MRFDPPVVEGGNVTTLMIQASDDMSGVKSVSGEIRSPNASALLPFNSSNAGGGGVYTFPITIPRTAQTGTWYVAWISLIDGADNSGLIQASSAATAPPGGTLTVNSPEADSTPPEITQVWFDKATINGGEKNVIRVDARDDGSGVASMMGACQSRAGSAIIWFNGTYNADSGTLQADVLVPKNADCGDWIVQQLSVKDNAGNTALLKGDAPVLARAGFLVSYGSGCDSTPPSLDAFQLTPTVVSSDAAAQIVVTASVYEDESGTASVTGWFDGPVSTGGQVPKLYFKCSPTSKDPKAPWTGIVQVPQFAAKGVWKVGAIRLEDNAHNFRTYTSTDAVVSGAVFEVQ